MPPSYLRAVISKGEVVLLLQFHVTANHFFWFSPLQQTDSLGVVYQFLSSSVVKGLLETF